MARVAYLDPQLQALAELLSRAYRAASVAQLANVVCDHMQRSLPANRRDPLQLGDLRNRLEQALAVVPAVKTVREGPGLNLHAALNEAAGLIEPHVPASATILRAAADGICDAARLLMERQATDVALTMIRDLELLGAPPAAAFRGDGTWLWTNSALQELIERRALDGVQLVAECAKAAMESRDWPTSLHLRAAALHLDVTRHGSVVVVNVLESARRRKLTDREADVAREVCRARGYRQAAENLNLPLEAVRRHVRRAYQKLGVRNRAALKARLMREGLLPGDRR